MKIGQKFHAVDRIGLESEFSLEGGEDGVFQCRAIGDTLKRCERDVEIHKQICDY